jgi:hypothetical protein
VQIGDPIRVVGIPQFGRIARLQTPVEQVAAGGSVGQEPGAFVK